MKKPFKFRVSYYLKDGKSGQTEQKTFPFLTYAQAKRHYKMIVLGLYRNKGLSTWEICLNRYSYPEWEAPLYYECLKE